MSRFQDKEDNFFNIQQKKLEDLQNLCTSYSDTVIDIKEQNASVHSNLNHLLQEHKSLCQKLQVISGKQDTCNNHLQQVHQKFTIPGSTLPILNQLQTCYPGNLYQPHPDYNISQPSYMQDVSYQPCQVNGNYGQDYSAEQSGRNLVIKYVLNRSSRPEVFCKKKSS